MKRILFFVCLLMSVYASAQKRPAWIGTTENTNIIRGDLVVDSLFYFPVRDTAMKNRPIRDGAAIIYGSRFGGDNKVYYFDSANNRFYRDTAFFSSSDTVINNIYHGSTAGLRSLNNPAVIQANTEDYGKGIFVRDTSDHATSDNWGTVIVSADGGRFKRQYDGYDQFIWYKSTGASDSAALSKALLNCRDGQGVAIDSSVVDELSYIIVNRDNITIKGIPGKTILKLKRGAAYNNIFIFQDSADKKITGVKIQGITFDGNGDTTSNATLIKVGGTSLKGSGQDTVKNVTIENCEFVNTPKRGGFWMVSDTLRNDGWVFDRNTFDSGQTFLASIWGSNNMEWKGTTFKNWGNGDTSNPAFSIASTLTKGLNFHDNKFYGGSGGRFAIEFAVSLVNATFKDNFYDGNGRGVSGTSGGACYNCKFINETKTNGNGDWKGGYEIVGGGITIENPHIENGAITLSAHGGGTPAAPAGYENLLDSGFVVKNPDINNQKGYGISVGNKNGGSAGMKNITITGGQITTGGTEAGIQVHSSRSLTVDGTTINAGGSSIILYNEVWSGTDSVSRDIIVRNTTLKAREAWKALGYPNIQIGTPASQTFNRYKYVTLKDNKYSHPYLFYNDSLVNTWVSVGNKNIDDTTNTYAYDRRALFSRGFGSPEGKISADRGSTYTDISNNKRYSKTTDAVATGWSELPTVIFNSERANNYLMVGKGPGNPMDTTNIVKIDPATGNIGFGNTTGSLAYQMQYIGDSTKSTYVRLWLINPAKTSTRFMSIGLADGNGTGVTVGYNGSYSYLSTLLSTYLRFQINNVTYGYLSPSGIWGIRNPAAAAGEMLALGGVGDPGQWTMYGGTSGKVTVKAGDIITTYTLYLPLSPGSVGQVLKLTGSAAGVLSSAWADDNSGGGGGGSGSLEFIE